jgi:hypothetical protein
VPHLRIFGLTLAIACVSTACGAGNTAEQAGQQPMVLSDVHITGEFLTPTPATAKAEPGGAVQAAPTVKPTLGPISFQTPTAVPSGVVQLSTTDAEQPEPQATSAAENSGASIQSGSSPLQTQRTPTPPPPTATPVVLTKGQSLQVNLPAGNVSCDTSQTFKFRYPGDSSVVTIDAQLDGLNPGNAGNAGMHVWDSTSTSAPVANATTLNNQKNNVFGSIELMYQRPIAGAVTIELYNWTQTPLSGTVTVVTLASNFSPLQVVQEKSPGAC